MRKQAPLLAETTDRIAVRAGHTVKKFSPVNRFVKKGRVVFAVGATGMEFESEEPRDPR